MMAWDAAVDTLFCVGQCWDGRDRSLDAVAAVAYEHQLSPFERGTGDVFHHRDKDKDHEAIGLFVVHEHKVVVVAVHGSCWPGSRAYPRYES